MIVAVGSDQAEASWCRQDDALEDEAVRRLGQEDLGEAALVDEGADRAQDLLVVLARAALVDAHRVPPMSAPVGASEAIPEASGPTRFSRGPVRTIPADGEH